jgi:hypothetical protein
MPLNGDKDKIQGKMAVLKFLFRRHDDTSTELTRQEGSYGAFELSTNIGITLFQLEEATDGTLVDRFVECFEHDDAFLSSAGQERR